MKTDILVSQSINLPHPLNRGLAVAWATKPTSLSFDSETSQYVTTLGSETDEPIILNAQKNGG